MSAKEYPRKCPHIKPWTIKWGISGGQRWCDKCKKYIYPKIDWDGHP